MQQVVAGLNPSSGADFVLAYIDNILLFSCSLEKHLQPLQLVIKRLVEVGLKLEPAKCKFVWRELEYLGHVVTCEGLKTNPRVVEAL